MRGNHVILLALIKAREHPLGPELAIDWEQPEDSLPRLLTEALSVKQESLSDTELSSKDREDLEHKLHLWQDDLRRAHMMSNELAINEFLAASLASGREAYTSYYAITSAGALYSWGYNGDGQLGDGGTTNATIATLRTGGTLAGKTITKVFGGPNYAMAIDSAGNLHAWGTNTTYGQLGNGTLSNQFTPVQSVTGGVCFGCNCPCRGNVGPVGLWKVSVPRWLPSG